MAWRHIDEAFKQGFLVEEIWELDYNDLSQIRRAGWSAQNVWKARLGEPYQLRQGGYSAADLRKVGCTAKELKLAGYSLEELRNAGFSHEVLRECTSDLSRHKANRTSDETGIALQPLEELSDGLPAARNQKAVTGIGELRWWTTPRIQAMLDTPGSNLPPRAGTAPGRL